MAPDNEIDLRDLGPQSTETAEATPVAEEFKEEEYNPVKDRENVRGNIAKLLIGCLVGVVIVLSLTALVTMYVCAQKDVCTPDTLELKPFRTVIEIIFTPLVGLVGAVTGFYYGEKATTASNTD